MRVRSRRAARMWSHLVAIALIPLFGLGTFSAIVSTSSWKTAKSRATLNENVRLVGALAATGSLLTRETFLVSALLYGEGYGIDAAGVGRLIGVDVPSALTDARAQVSDQFGRLPAGDPALLHRTELEQLRRDVDARAGRPAELAQRYAALSTRYSRLVDARLTEVSDRAIDVTGSADTQRSLTVLLNARSAAQASMAQLGSASNLVFSQGDGGQTMREVRQATASLDMARFELDRLATGATGEAWRTVSADPALQQNERRYTALGNGDVAAARRVPLPELATMFAQGLDRLGRYEGVVRIASDQAVSVSERERASALQTLRLALSGTALIVVLTLLLTVGMVRLVVHPLRRLRDHAQKVSTGALEDLGVEPLGPRELRDVETTFAEVVANVRTVEAQLAALAAGSPDDPVLRQPVPGRLGALLHDSVERLSRSMAEREAMAAALAYEARHDALTGLPNRVAAAEELTRALSRAQRAGSSVAVLYIDLDGFKHVNDNLGHGAGDAVLNGTAARLSECIRGGDFAARIGGDEFLVITEQAAAPGDVVELGRRIVAGLSEPMAIGTGVTRVGASVGVAFAHDGETDGERLLGDADVAAYQAKASGRGRVEVFGEDLRVELARHAEIEAALRDALDGDELELFFQPVVDPEGCVGGAEALLRWRRPGIGLVPPGDFIPVAESSDLIIDIGRWVLERSCEHLATWVDDPELGRLAMSINLSGRHLLNLTVVDDVRAALARHGVAAERLTVEITETTMLTDVPLVHEHLGALRRMGVRVAIDDFGTGYTSLAHLRSLPVDVLKIDRSMIMNSDRQPDAHVLALLVETAHALGLRLVAEGVETAQQLSTVRDLGCQSIQGFLFSRPVPVDELRAFIAANASLAALP